MHQPTVEKLHDLRLGAMANALTAQLQQPEIVNRHGNGTPYRHPKGTPFVAICCKPEVFLCSADEGRFFAPA
jgi:hypothetical protein